MAIPAQRLKRSVNDKPGIRECLRCGKKFMSDGPHNRICCEPQFEPDGLKGLKLPEDLRLLKGDQELRKEAIEERKQQKLRCPVCGETVYRPGNATDHKCFQESQEALEAKHRDLCYISTEVPPLKMAKREGVFPEEVTTLEYGPGHRINEWESDSIEIDEESS